MQQQSVQHGRDMRVSAIPLTSARTRDRDTDDGSVYIPNRRVATQHNKSSSTAAGAPKFEDIMNERPDPSAMYHSSLPEDHLEDILTFVYLFYLS